MWIVSDALDIDIECIYVCMYQIFDFDYSDSDMVEILIVGIHIRTMYQVFEPLSDGRISKNIRPVFIPYLQSLSTLVTQNKSKNMYSEGTSNNETIASKKQGKQISVSRVMPQKWYSILSAIGVLKCNKRKINDWLFKPSEVLFEK